MADNTNYGAGTYNTGVYAPFAVNPDPATDPETVGTPSVSFTATATPTSAADPVTLGTPAAATASTVNPAGIADAETLTGPSVAASGQLVPDTITDAASPGTPGVAFTTSAAPGSVADTVTLGAPTLAFVIPVAPDTITDAAQVGTPAVTDNSSAITYGTGLYGGGTYVGTYLADDQACTPDQVGDTEAVGTPGVEFVANVNPNWGYGDGLYDKGVYFGSTDSIDPQQPDFVEATPLWAPLPLSVPVVAQHVIGIGPWSIQVHWRGATNYRIYPGYYIPRPIIGMPPATSKSFTLRVNDGGEARAEFAFPLDGAVLPQEMATDVWWRRRDPFSGELEVIGRFNINGTDVSRTDTGITVNCQMVDYRTLLGDRMVMGYKDQANSENQWGPNTKVVDILRWAVPRNMGLDLTNLDTTDPIGLGVTTRPFEIALGATMTELFDNLLAISARAWEWWVEMPVDATRAPKLNFSIGPRGADHGVVLVDVGGPTPIASWTMTNFAERYANSLYFIGADGGEVVQDAAQIAAYGQRDTSDSDSSIKGTKNSTGLPYLLDAAAQKRLAQMADRRPTWTVTLKEGFWRGRGHIDIGDTVGVVIGVGGERFTGKWRVTELAVEIDSGGTETVTLTLGTPLTSGNPYSRRSAMARIVARLKNYERKES